MNKLFIPNAITSLNIISGTISIFISLKMPELLYISAGFIILASIFDFLDGFVARLLNAQSEFGKQMDSFSDLVSFGLAPTFIMYNLLSQSGEHSFIPFISFVIIVFSAIRLSIFNITDQKTQFVGLPTPAFALFVVSIPLAGHFSLNLAHINIYSILTNKIVLISITILFSVLLVSKLNMFSLKFKNFKMKDNKLRFIFLIISLLLLLIFAVSAIPIIIALYVIFSMVFISQKKV